MSNTLTANLKLIRNKSIVSALTIVGAVALPQIFHVVGAASGMGPALGQAFLPMHLVILMAGLIYGPIVGVVAGLFSPILSYALTGMPLAATLPFMAIELAVYGLLTGILKDRKMPVLAKVVIAQIVGRIVKALAFFVALQFFGTGVAPISVFTAVVTGLPGIILQLTVLPLFVFWYERRGINE